MNLHSTHAATSTAEQSTASHADEWPALEVFDVVKQWVKGGPRVLDELNLTIEHGQMVWVGGQNGAGKTTLLRVVSGLIDATSGQIRAYGLHPIRDRRRFQRRVSFLSAGNVGVYARLSVRGQLEIWARIAFVERGSRARVINEVMETFNLHPIAHQRSDRLSMGQRQRLRLAMTFIGDPELILLDEPRTSLDGEGGDMLTKAVQGVAARGGSVLWCSPTGESLPLDFDQHCLLEHGKLRDL